MKMRNTSNVDAPCGATHYYANNRGVGFYKLRDEKWMFWSPDDSEWKPVVDNYPAFRAIELPQEENQMNIDKVETQSEESMQPRAKHFEVKKEVHLRDYQKKTQTEHQEEMSSFSGEVEWKNGDKCLYMNSEVAHTVIGRDDKYKDSFWCKSSCGNINLLEAACLSKPETPQQREDRERLEAAFELCCTYGHTDFETANDFKQFHPSLCDKWLAIVDKTNYRKGVK